MQGRSFLDCTLCRCPVSLVWSVTVITEPYCLSISKLVEWLVVGSVDLPVGKLVGWLVVASVDWSVDSLVYRLASGLVDWSVGGFISQLVG